jgi:hypothetical protein
MINNQNNIQKKKMSKPLLIAIIGGCFLFFLVIIYFISDFIGMFSLLFPGQDLNQSDVKKISIAALENMYEGKYSVKRYFKVECGSIDDVNLHCDGGIILKDTSSNIEYNIELYYKHDENYDIEMELKSCEYHISLKNGWSNFWVSDIIDNIDSSCSD